MATACAVIQGFDQHVSRYLDNLRVLTQWLDEENQQLLMGGQVEALLRGDERQQEKQVLLARVETLARIVRRSMEIESDEAMRETTNQVEAFRRSLRLNSALLDVCIERQERKLACIMQSMEAQRSDAHVEDALIGSWSGEGAIGGMHVVDRSL